jgi:isocitrate/isopropylmalate dehydrogenase
LPREQAAVLVLADLDAPRRHDDTRFAGAAETIDRSVDALLKDPATRTADLGGKLGTKAFTAALCSETGGRLR